MPNVLKYENHHYIHTGCYFSEEYLTALGCEFVKWDEVFNLSVFKPNVIYDHVMNCVYFPLDDPAAELINLYNIAIKHTTHRFDGYIWYMFLPTVCEQTNYAILHRILKRKGRIEIYKDNIVYAVIESEEPISLKTELGDTYQGTRILVPISKAAKVVFSAVNRYSEISANEQWFDLYFPVIFDYQLELIDKVVEDPLVYALMVNGIPVYTEDSRFPRGYALELSKHCYYIILCPISNGVYMGVTYELLPRSTFVWSFRIGKITRPLTKLSLEKCHVINI